MNRNVFLEMKREIEEYLQGWVEDDTGFSIHELREQLNDVMDWALMRDNKTKRVATKYTKGTDFHIESKP